MSAPEMGYCYRLPGCGCVVAATLDGDTPAQKREVTRFKRDPKLQGFTLDHLPAEEIRSLPWGWPCEHMKAGAVDAA